MTVLSVSLAKFRAIKFYPNFGRAEILGTARKRWLPRGRSCKRGWIVLKKTMADLQPILNFMFFGMRPGKLTMPARPSLNARSDFQTWFSLKTLRATESPAT